MSYGIGTIPFVRTSDLSHGEIKAYFKHGVRDESYEDFQHQVDVKRGDILLVKDTTYLTGSSAIVTEAICHCLRIGGRPCYVY